MVADAQVTTYNAAIRAREKGARPGRARALRVAGPGARIGAGSTAEVLYGRPPYGWSFATRFAVGSILAATDPVAVVSRLKTSGSPQP